MTTTKKADLQYDVEIYDHFQRNFRDKDMLPVERIIKSGISKGTVLEIGPGPGYLGLEWLRRTNNSILTGIEINDEMISMAERNSRDYRLQDLTQYVLGDAERMPFDEGNFDAVFSNGSLHEWSDPLRVLKQIHRVLVPGGKFFVSDLRRDVSSTSKWLMNNLIQPREIRPGLISSLQSAYTMKEVHEMTGQVPFTAVIVSQNPFGLTISGSK